MAHLDEIASGIYRIAAFNSAVGITFNQYLIADDEPLLFQTGKRAQFAETLDAVRQVIDPAALRWVSWSHLEGDEAGAANDFLAAAPHAQPVVGEIGARVSADFIIRPPRAMKDGEVLDLGRHRLRFLATPHVPHCWDAVLPYEEASGVLFVSDLFTLQGEQPALTEADVVEPATAYLRGVPDILPLGPRTFDILDRLARLEPKMLAAHHGPTIARDATRSLVDMRSSLARFAQNELTARG